MNLYQFAGRLIHPSAKEFGKFESDIDVEGVLDILKRNKVPLVALSKEQYDAIPQFYLSPRFKACYEEEYALYSSLRNEWQKVREKFLMDGIESMFIKSVGLFDYKSSNLDIMIKQQERRRAESILKDLGYIQLHNVEEPYKTLFRTFSGGVSNSVIHLHNKVAWINPFHDETLLWARFRHSDMDDVVDVPSPEDSILILTAHWFYEDKEIKLSDIMRVSACLAKKDLDWEYMISVTAKMGWLAGFCFALLVQARIEENIFGESFISEERKEMMQFILPAWMKSRLQPFVYSKEIQLPFPLPKKFGKFLHIVKTFKDNTTTTGRKIYEAYRVTSASVWVVLFYKFKINLRYQPPFLISISGVDGCGKSTYGGFVYDMLLFCELKTRYYWSRVGSSGFLKPFAKIAKAVYRKSKISREAAQTEDFAEASKRRQDIFGQSYVVRCAGLSILLAEMLGQYFVKVALPLLLKRVVLCDRYTYDTLVDISVRYNIDLNSREGKIFSKLLLMLTPAPDIAYVLHIPLEDALRRKEAGEEEQDFIKRQIDCYQDLARKYNLHVINSSDSESITATNDLMINDILNLFYDKWKR